MAQGKNGLHVAMFPWLAFGHMIPYLELAKFIAQKGHKVSFISTPRNIDRLPELPQNFASMITFVKIPLPKVPQLPESAEATMDIRPEEMDLLKKAFDKMETGLTQFLEESVPDWILYDFAPYWLPSIAARLGVSRAFFCIINAWFLVFLGPADTMLTGSDGRSRAEDFTVPPKWVPFETKVAYRRYEAEWSVGSKTGDNASGVSDLYRGGKVISEADAVFLRDCYEFEPKWLNLLKELYHKPIIPVGLMPPEIRDTGGRDDESWQAIKDWLDGRENGSVIYVALGSEVTPTQDKLTELAMGLEASTVPFFWAIRNLKSDSVMLPNGFEERTKSRGIVWKSWAPQLKILSHDSVGAFLTHCGWSSIVEGLMFGRPLVTLPFLVDQGLNSRIILEKQLGIEIPRNEQEGSYSRYSVADSVKLLMLENEGNTYREKAKEVSKIFGNKELHNSYIENFIKFLEDHRSAWVASHTEFKK